jgi:tryptophanyl-tRNA synthetase
MKTLFSGIQPSGELHLGNYLGAIRNWIDLQESHRCFFCIVDYHAITQDYEPKLLAQRTFEMAVDLLALGIDPERSVLFVQSAVPEHTELCWVLNTVTMQGDLERMTQYKDKSQRQEDNINVGLFDYPVLQAADILLYKAQAVPVGQDQVQHIEIARRIARGFNRRWGKLFPEPEALLSKVPKLLGLDGQAKMSKSMGNTIALNATDKQIRKSLASSATDPARVTREDPGNPFVCNLYTLHTFFSDPPTLEWVREGCSTAGIGCVDCKTRLADNVIAHLTPYRARRQELLASPDRVRQILRAGAEKARAVAGVTMAEARAKVGLMRE